MRPILMIGHTMIMCVAGTALGADITFSGWGGDSLVFGEVTHISRPGLGTSQKIGIRPFGTLSGGFDAGAVSNSAFEMDYTAYAEDARPRAGNKVVVLLSSWESDSFREGVRASFLPGPHTPLKIVKGLDDVDVYDAVNNIHMLRKQEKENEATQAHPDSPYWATHSLVFGRIRDVTRSSRANPPLSIDFRALLTVSGGFDVAVTPELYLGADDQVMVQRDRTDPGPDALVLLVRANKSWAIASEFAEFMPGKHAPICAMESFSDAKVLSVLRAIQQLRKKETDAKSANQGNSLPGSPTKR